MLPEDPVPDVRGREAAGGVGRRAAPAAQVGQTDRQTDLLGERGHRQPALLGEGTDRQTALLGVRGHSTGHALLELHLAMRKQSA